MWANAQRDSRPAEHRWRPLFNAASLADAHYLTAVQQHCQDAKAVEIRWGAQLVNRSQPLVGRDIWRTYCCLTSFFPIVDMYLSYENIA